MTRAPRPPTRGDPSFVRRAIRRAAGERDGRLGEPAQRVDPRLIFTPDHTALYVSVPKTGCTTIKTVMALAVGMTGPEAKDYLVGNRSIHNAWKAREVKWSALGKRARARMLFRPSTFRFTSVRNPFERVVSCYIDKILNHRRNSNLGRHFAGRGAVSLLSFLREVENQAPLERDIHCRAMTDLTFTGRFAYDDIVRYETFDDDLRRVMARLGLPDAPVPGPHPDDTTNAKARLPELLGARECALIREIYAADFEAFEYPASPP